MVVWDNLVIRYKNARNPSSSADKKQVTIGIDKDTQNGTKTLVLLTPPQSSINWSSGKKDTKMLDLQRIEERVTIDGMLITGHSAGTTNVDVGDGTGNNTYTEQVNSSDKKDDFIEIFNAGGQVWVTSGFWPRYPDSS